MFRLSTPERDELDQRDCLTQSERASIKVQDKVVERKKAQDNQYQANGNAICHLGSPLRGVVKVAGWPRCPERTLKTLA